MPTQRQLQAGALYGGLMEEIKIRISAIDAGTGGHLTALHHQVIQEHCFLQLRMICELIALGCLTAHGDIDGVHRRLKKEWAADRIMDELEKLHPDFYPVTLERRTSREDVSVRPLATQPLPKAELIKIYHRCGGVLHRGNIKKLLDNPIPVPIKNPEITALALKVLNLLTYHMVMMQGGQTFFLVILQNRDDNKKVQVAIAEHMPQPPSP